MAKPSKSKNQFEDEATYKATHSSEEDDEVLEADGDSDLEKAGRKSPSTNNDAGDKEAKTEKKLTSKRRKVSNTCTSSEHSWAVQVVVGNEDLLTKILLLVPAKSLLKFKSVSKHWHSLISDSKFASNHSCRNYSSSFISGVYIYHKTLEPRSVSLHGHLSLPTFAFLDPIREGSESRVVNSCNGLMLFSNGGKFSRMQYIVCNPTTQKFIALPRPGGSTSYRSTSNFGAYLAFDPSKSPFYKVVLVGYLCKYKERPSSYLIHIYSSKTMSWKKMHAKAPCGGSYQSRAFWNGAIHWMNRANMHIRFDVDEENLTGTIMPKVPNILAEEKIQFFGECGGSLLLIQTRELHALRLRILEMEKDCCRWIVKYRVNMVPMRYAFHHGYVLDFKVLCCAKGPHKKIPSLVLEIGRKVVAFNPNLKSLKVLRDLQCKTEQPCYHLQCNTKQPCYHSYHSTYRFIESLSPV